MFRRPASPPDREKSVNGLLRDREALQQSMNNGAYAPTVGDRYVHWDKLRHLTPLEGLTREQWWGAIKLARLSMLKPLPLLGADGRLHQVAVPDPLQRQLSEADRDLSGRVKLPEQLTNPGTRDRYMVSALIEEAITSSQLEGAATTRQVANEMLRSGRQPKTHDERMIFNNFQAMRFIRRIAPQPLTPELVCQLHSRITDGTMQDGADCGRMRTTDDVRVVAFDGETLHQPPKAAELSGRMREMCDFANEKTPDFFLHSIVRAVLLHYWLAYDHPFTDGNGRTARALFYWSMLHSGYWLCEYISISHVLRKAPSKYASAYLYTQTDDNDVTYFVLYQMNVLQRTIRALHEYVQAKIDMMNSTQRLLKQSQHFNHRQLALLSHAIGYPHSQYTATAHATTHMVTRQTARTDLKDLADKGLLQTIHVGNGLLFVPPQDLESRLESYGRRRG